MSCLSFFATGFVFFYWSANVTLRFEPVEVAAALVVSPELFVRKVVDEWSLSVVGAAFVFALLAAFLGAAADSVADGCG